jgi:aspartate dehydrogenase
MDIGIIGAGAIANVMMERINHDRHENLKVKSVFVRNEEKYQHLEEEFGITLYTDLEAFLSSDIDIVVEAANGEVVKSHMPEVLKHKDAMLISVGALADGALVAELMQIAKHHDHPPSAIRCDRRPGPHPECAVAWGIGACQADDEETRGCTQL